MLVQISNKAVTAADPRVDKLLSDEQVTREDLAQIVQWLVELSDKVDATKTPRDMAARAEIDILRERMNAVEAGPTWPAVEKIARDVDRLRDDIAVSDANDIKLYKDVNDLQNALKKLQQTPPQPPVQKVDVHQHHTYQPESALLMWCAIGFCLLVGALAHVL